MRFQPDVPIDRGSLLPIITIAGFLLPLLIGGAVVVEYVFALGIGRLAVDSVFAREYWVILTITISAHCRHRLQPRRRRALCRRRPPDPVWLTPPWPDVHHRHRHGH